MSQPAPIFYKDSLAARAAPTRYRNIGNPYAFLTGIGIDAILEEMYKGRNIVDVAKTLNVSITILLNWITNEGHMQAVDAAAKWSAEGYISEASEMLRSASNDFELKKAKELATHGRFMASKLNRGTYGQEKPDAAPPVGVTFIMHMGEKTLHMPTIDAKVVATQTPDEITQDDHTFSIRPYRAMFNATKNPEVVEPDAIGPFEPEPLILEGAPPPDYLKDLT